MAMLLMSRSAAVLFRYREYVNMGAEALHRVGMQCPSSLNPIYSGAKECFRCEWDEKGVVSARSMLRREEIDLGTWSCVASGSVCPS
jgi:hypothetical protein